MTTEITEPSGDPASPLVTDKPVTRTKGSAHGRRKRERKRQAALPDMPPTFQAKHGKFGSARAKILRRVARGAHGVERAREIAASYEQLRLTWRFLDRAGRKRMGRQVQRQLDKYKAARLEQEAARRAKAALEGTVDKRVLDGMFP